jgi:hypothetical protein
VHLPIAIAALLGQLVPRLGLAEQLAHRALTKTEHVLGEQPLTDIVYRQQLAHLPGYQQRVEILRGAPVHVVAQHLLQPRLHGVALRDEGFAQPTGHPGGAELVAESERVRAIVEAKGTLERVEDAQAADIVVRQMVAVVVVVVA